MASPGVGLGAKTPDELYVALRKAMPQHVRVSSDKKAGVIVVEVEDEDPKFAAELANAHVVEVTKLLSRLAVSEAQLQSTKENLIEA